jgi:hypothetical protein
MISDGSKVFLKPCVKFFVCRCHLVRPVAGLFFGDLTGGLRLTAVTARDGSLGITIGHNLHGQTPQCISTIKSV